MAVVGIALLGVGLAPDSSLMRDEDASPQDQVSASIEPIPGGSSVSAGPSDINGGFPCRLVGWRAADAISYFSKDNVTVEWAFESPTDSEGVGYRSTPESVPLNSIIMDVSRIDAGTDVRRRPWSPGPHARRDAEDKAQRFRVLMGSWSLAPPLACDF